VKERDDKDLLQRLRECGYRVTPQRMMVLQAIEASDDHISAEEVHSKAQSRYPYINILTVYRTLKLLEELGPQTACTRQLAELADVTLQQMCIC